jgi:hypothetical protein
MFKNNTSLKKRIFHFGTPDKPLKAKNGCNCLLITYRYASLNDGDTF